MGHFAKCFPLTLAAAFTTHLFYLLFQVSVGVGSRLQMASIQRGIHLFLRSDGMVDFPAAFSGHDQVRKPPQDPRGSHLGKAPLLTLITRRVLLFLKFLERGVCVHCLLHQTGD